MLASVLSCAVANADVSDYGSYDFVVDGIYYDILSGADNECAVSDPDASHRYSSEIVIPERVEYNGTTYTVTAIGDGAFTSCNVTGVSMPNTVTAIGMSAFQYSAITGIELPSSLETIGEVAFNNCPALTSVTIPNSVTRIDMGAFSGCQSLREVVIGNSLTTISNNTFMLCPALETVTIGSSVTEIGSNAFMNCSAIKTINSLNPTPPSITGSYVFADKVYSAATLNVPVGASAAYRDAAVWQNFDNIKESTLSGITAVNTQSRPVIEAADGRITIKGADGRVAIYDVSGTLVNSTDARGDVEIAVPDGNIYIVKTPSLTVKVAM